MLAAVADTEGPGATTEDGAASAGTATEGATSAEGAAPEGTAEEPAATVLPAPARIGFTTNNKTARVAAADKIPTARYIAPRPELFVLASTASPSEPSASADSSVGAETPASVDSCAESPSTAAAMGTDAGADTPGLTAVDGTDCESTIPFAPGKVLERGSSVTASFATELARSGAGSVLAACDSVGAPNLFSGLIGCSAPA